MGQASADMQSVAREYQAVRASVRRTARVKRLVGLGEGAARWAILVLLVAAALVGAVAFFGPPAWLRAALLLAMAAVLGSGAVRWVLLPLARRSPLWREALWIEQVKRWEHNPLVGALQLYEEAAAGPVGYSLGLARRQVCLGARLAEAEELSRLVSRATLRRRGAFLGVLALACAAGAGLWGSQVASALRSLAASYHELYQQLFPLTYEVSPGDKVILRGEPVTLAVRFPKPTRREVGLVIAPEGQAQSAPERLPPSGVECSRLVEGSERSFRYWFVIGGTPTEAHTITVTERPRIVAMEFEFIYPAYTRLGQTTFRGALSTVKGLVGTTVRLSLAANKAIKEGSVTVPGDPPFAMDVSGRYLATAFVIEKNTELALDLVCVHGYRMAERATIQVVAIPDRPPEVKLLVKGGEVFLTEKELETFGFGVEAKDDYGIQKLTCRCRLGALPGHEALREPREGQVSKPCRTASTALKAAFDQVLKGVDITYGERATVWVEAEDNCQPTPNVGRSTPFHVVLYRPDLGKFVDERELGWFGKYGPAFGKRSETLLMPPGLSRKETGVRAETFPVEAAPRKDLWSVEYGEITRSYFRVLAEEQRPPQH